MDVTLKEYGQFKPSIINAVQSIIVDDPESFPDEFKAFDYFAFTMFSDVEKKREYFCMTDGKNDQGIDFYTKDEIGNSYEIFQCKFIDLEKIERSEDPFSFDQQGVNQIENAYKYLTSPNVQDTGNAEVKSLRAQLLANKYEDINFNLCIFGYLTDDANQKWELLKTKCERDGKVALNLYDYKSIVTNLVAQKSYHKNICHKFAVSATNEAHYITTNDFCYFLGYGKDFRELFYKYGWSLFNLNVRAEIKNSKINKKIIESIKHDKSRKKFHHLNNGLLLLCDNYVVNPKTNSITLNNLQIINGCQTVVSIFKGFDEISKNKDKVSDFNDNCYVQVKAIKKSKDILDMIDDIIVATNNQNPMSPRNLKSNSQEQKRIRLMFDHLVPKWYYQRKDGEFEAIKSSPLSIGQLKKDDYKVDKDIWRVIDNQDLAKSWICFTGLSSEAMMTTDFFRKESQYELIFNKYPAKQLWADFVDTDIEFEYNEEYFEAGKIPQAEEYLLSYLIWLFIKEYSINPRDNRNQAIQRGIKAKKIKADINGKPTSSTEDVAKFLATDDEYMVNNIINNMKEVYLEMYSFILTQKYGDGYKIAKTLLSKEPFLSLVNNPNIKHYILKMEKDRENLLYSIYEYIKYVLRNLYMSIESEYAASSRRKSFLANKSFIQKLKRKIVEIDQKENFRKSIEDFKEINKSFINSMPDL